MAEKLKHSNKVFISYAWGGESERIAGEVREKLTANGLEVVQDKSGGLDYKGLIKEFMQEIGKGNFVVVIISDKYLRSENCMFELIEIAKNGSFIQRIYPIILADAKIYKPKERIKYLKHWETEIRELNEALKGLQDVGDIADIQDELSFYKEIRKQIGTLAGKLKNMNTLTPEMHLEKDFQQIYDQIEGELKAEKEFGTKELKLKEKVLEAVVSKEFEHDIFLSFSNKDAEFVNEIGGKLRAYGLRVFMSNDSLARDGGKPFFERINYALNHSKHFLLSCTPNAMDSGWVKHEYSSFFSEHYIPSKGERRLMILKGPDFNLKQVPTLLRTIQINNTIEEVLKHFVTPAKVKEEKAKLEEAKKQLAEENEEKLWEETKEKDTQKAYENYLQTSKLRRYVDDASTLRASRIQEESRRRSRAMEEFVWKPVKEKNTIEGYEEYLKVWGNGFYKEEAEKRIKALKQKPKYKSGDIIKDLPWLEMVFVEGGSFEMGSNDGRNNEKPVHTVELDNFLIGKYPVTQAQWKEIMGEKPSKFKGCDNCPVENVSWNMIQEFIKKLNAKTGLKYSLPTEAQWEYAARGGNKSKGFGYAGSDHLAEVAWYSDTSDRKTHPVGGLEANELGLYDMSGNVWEWCNDWYAENYYANSPAKNPLGPETGNRKVVRGGSWSLYDFNGRVAYRYDLIPDSRFIDIAFRISRAVSP